MTLAAFERGIAMGADGLECDVRMTADGHLVCWHDATVDRTSDGRGAVSRKTLQELRRLDCSSWFVPRASPLEPPASPGSPGWSGAAGGGGIVTLRELLELLRDQPRPVTLALETKHPSAVGGRVEEQVAVELRRVGWDEPLDAASARVRVMSFSAAALARMKQHCPAVPVVHLSQAALDARLPAIVEHDMKIALGVSIRSVREQPGRVTEWLSSGREVHVWTVDEISDMDLCHSLQVGAMISNRPDLAVSRVKKSGH